MNGPTLLVSSEVTQYGRGTGPVLDLTGAHHINWLYERYPVTYLDTVTALGVARSSHGWTVTIGKSESGPNKDGRRTYLVVAVLDGPDQHRQVIYSYGQETDLVYMLAGERPFDLNHLFRLPDDPSAMRPEDKPALIDEQWRRVERLHALATGVTVTGDEEDLTVIPNWWQLPRCLGWATFPDIESADAYWDDFDDPNHAYDWFQQGIDAPEAVPWAKEGFTVRDALRFRASGWTSAQAAQFKRAVDITVMNDQSRTTRDWVDCKFERNRWERIVVAGTHTPDQVITAVKAGLSPAELANVDDWASVAVMAALRDTGATTSRRR